MDAAWTIQRKPEAVQLSAWRPVYYSDYYPLDRGEPSQSRDRAWQLPWHAEAGAAAWHYESQGPRWRYAGGAELSTLSFRMTEEMRDVLYPYNDTVHQGPGWSQLQDLRLAATIAPQAVPGAATQGLRLWMYLKVAGLEMRGVIEPDGVALLQSRKPVASAAVPRNLTTTL